MTHYSATFAKLPIGETVIVLSLNWEKRSMTVGTRRPEKFPVKGQIIKYKTMRVFVDSLVFQCGVVRADGTGREVSTEPYWYDPWKPAGDNWVLFDELYKEEEKKEKTTLPYARKWTDRYGNFIAYGKFENARSGCVRIKKPNGALVTLQLTSLSKADQKLIENCVIPED